MASPVEGCAVPSSRSGSGRGAIAMPGLGAHGGDGWRKGLEAEAQAGAYGRGGRVGAAGPRPVNEGVSCARTRRRDSWRQRGISDYRSSRGIGLLFRRAKVGLGTCWCSWLLLPDGLAGAQQAADPDFDTSVARPTRRPAVTGCSRSCCGTTVTRWSPAGPPSIGGLCRVSTCS